MDNEKVIYKTGAEDDEHLHLTEASENKMETEFLKHCMAELLNGYETL